MSDRAVSSPVGIVLILGITIASVAVLFGVGGTVVSDTRADAERSQMENAMSGFSSKASLVGLGESGDQRFSLGRASEGDVTIDPNAGRVTLYVESPTERKELNSTSLGAVIYESGDTEVAYQGGGVWQRQGGFSRMISPPEYHYRLETLTFPIMTVSGNDRSSGTVGGTVRGGPDSNNWFPIKGIENRSNPLEEGTILIEVESRYCDGWEAFFTERSQSAIDEPCGDNETVTVDLTVPFELTTDKSVMGRSITLKGVDDSDRYEDPVSAPLIDSEIDNRIDECGTCDSLPGSSPITDGDYFEDGDASFGDVTFDTTEGDVNVIIDGDLNLDGDIEIDGSGSVDIYVNGNVNLQPGDYNMQEDTDATQLSILVHSNADLVDLTNNLDYTGIIYAPGSSIEIRGTTNIIGAIIGDDITLRGGVSLTEAPELDGYQIVGGDRPLTYLHVSENSIEIELD